MSTTAETVHFQFSTKKMDLILGTSMWGWTISKKTAFGILDYFYEAGFRQIDTATNYPISKNPVHWRLSENILAEWIDTHGIADLQIITKVGSLTNLFSSEHNLNKSFLLMALEHYQTLYKNNLGTFAIHWDNRADKQDIKSTFEALQIAQKQGLKLGFSGIKYPEIYANLCEDYPFDFRIQIKHNILQSDYPRYPAFHGQKRFITYGINAGGLKLQPEQYSENSYLKARGGDTSKPHLIIEKIQLILKEINSKKERPPIHHFYQIGMAYAFYSPDIQAILLGSSSVEQWKGNVAFFENLKGFGYEDLYRLLINKLP